MALRVVGPRTHLKIGELLEPEVPAGERMYKQSEVDVIVRKRVRLALRNVAREGAGAFFLFVLPIIVLVRKAVDKVVANPDQDLEWLIAILPYSTYLTFLLGLSLLIGSMFIVFRRHYK